MRNFTLGILATFGALVVGKKLYDKGYDEAKSEIKKEDKLSADKNTKKAK